MVLAAAEAVANGSSKEEVIALVNQLGKNMTVYAALPTLKYLAMGGRVGKLAAGLANTFKCDPFLHPEMVNWNYLEKSALRKKRKYGLLNCFSTPFRERKLKNWLWCMSTTASEQKIY